MVGEGFNDDLMNGSFNTKQDRDRANKHRDYWSNPNNPLIKAKRIADKKRREELDAARKSGKFSLPSMAKK